jgi:multidrug efflux pump subunit AcrB
VSLAILVSGVISLTLTPMLCSRFLKPEAACRKPGWFNRTCEGSFNWLLDHYTTGLRWVLRHPVFMMLVWLGTLVATVRLYQAVPKGFFPQQDTGIVMGSTDAAQDISFPAMAELQQKVARIG